MKILVTGAGGFLGFVIAKKLIQQGHEVTNFSRSHHTDLDEIGVKTIKGNLANREDVLGALEGFEAVFHVASKVAMWGKWDDFYQINTVGTENVLEACKQHGIKFLVYTSTPSVVFGKESLEGVDETQEYPEEFFSLYAHSKALAEQKVIQANGENLKTVSLRPHLIFGPRDPNIIPRLLEAGRKGKLKIVGDGENLVDVIYVDNAADAHLLAFEGLQKETCSGKSYFISQEKPVKLWDFINNILQSQGIAPVTKKISLKKAYCVGAVIEFFLKLFRIYNVHPPMTRFVSLQLGTSHYFDTKNSKNDLGYEPQVSLEQAIQKTIQSISKR